MGDWASVFAHKERGKDGRLFYREGMIAEELDIERIQLPDPHDEKLYRDGARRAIEESGILEWVEST